VVRVACDGVAGQLGQSDAKDSCARVDLSAVFTP